MTGTSKSADRMMSALRTGPRCGAVAWRVGAPTVAEKYLQAEPSVGSGVPRCYKPLEPRQASQSGLVSP